MVKHVVNASDQISFPCQAQQQFSSQRVLLKFNIGSITIFTEKILKIVNHAFQMIACWFLNNKATRKYLSLVRNYYSSMLEYLKLD